VTKLSDQQVDIIARQVLRRIPSATSNDTASILSAPNNSPSQTLGVFAELDDAIRAARTAFEALNSLTLAKRDEIITNIRQRMLDNAEPLASAAHRETGLGRTEDKIIKNRLVANKTPGTESLQAEVQTGDGKRSC